MATKTKAKPLSQSIIDTLTELFTNSLMEHEQLIVIEETNKCLFREGENPTEEQLNRDGRLANLQHQKIALEVALEELKNGTFGVCPCCGQIVINDDLVKELLRYKVMSPMSYSRCKDFRHRNGGVIPKIVGMPMFLSH